MEDHFNQMGLSIDYECVNQGMKDQLEKMGDCDTMLASKLRLCRSSY
jgi:hypothetical protein